MKIEERQEKERFEDDLFRMRAKKLLASEGWQQFLEREFQMRIAGFDLAMTEEKDPYRRYGLVEAYKAIKDFYEYIIGFKDSPEMEESILPEGYSVMRTPSDIKE